MEFCYTLPLQRWLNMKPPVPQTAAAPFFCWDVHMLTVQSRKAVLAMNRASRYSLLFYGMNRADDAGRDPGGHPAGGALGV